MVLRTLKDAFAWLTGFAQDGENGQQELHQEDAGNRHGGGMYEPGSGATALRLEEIPQISMAQQKYADVPDRLSDFNEMYEHAKWYLMQFEWHCKLLESRIAIYAEGFYGVYLFRIEPVSDEIPEWMWVVVGNPPTPPAVFPIDGCPNGVAAFQEYVRAIGEWIEAAKKGESTDDDSPVVRPPTLEESRLFERHLRFMSKDIYPDRVEFFRD